VAVASAAVRRPSKVASSRSSGSACSGHRNELRTNDPALAEFERDLIRERTRAGLTEARARRGRKGGHSRVKSLADPKELALAKRLYAAKEPLVGELARMFKVSRATFYRYMDEGATGTDGATARYIKDDAVL
jgi:hypothetical protein